jgi:hypothetical protein
MISEIVANNTVTSGSGDSFSGVLLSQQSNWAAMGGQLDGEFAHLILSKTTDSIYNPLYGNN